MDLWDRVYMLKHHLNTSSLFKIFFLAYSLIMLFSLSEDVFICAPFFKRSFTSPDYIPRRGFRVSSTRSVP